MIDELEENWKKAGDSMHTATNSSLSHHSTFSARHPTPLQSAETWAEKRPDSSNQSRSSSFKGNIGHLMKAIDLHRDQSPTVAPSMKTPISSPQLKLSKSGSPSAIDVQESMDNLSVCVSCDKMCYEDPSGFCANCGSRCRSAN